MSWLDKVKGAIYETDGTEQAAAPTAAPSAASVAPTSAPISLSPGVNAEMVSAIKKVTLGRNTAYTQLLQASEALADVIPDQVMRLKAAHKTAGAGRSGKQIADAVDVHLQDVDGEVMRFETMVQGKVAAEVGTIEAQAQLAQQQITQAQAEIQAAQQRIADLTTQIGQLTTAAAQATAQASAKRTELESAVVQFKAAAQVVRNELNGSKSAILSTLV